MVTKLEIPQYDNETFLANILGNFRDFMFNSTRKLQTYFDIIDETTNKIYHLDSINDNDEKNEFKKLHDFIVSEGYNITRAQVAFFINNYASILSARYEFFVKNIKKCPDNAKFKFSSEAFVALDNVLQYTFNENFDDFRYSKKTFSIYDYMDFTGYLKTELKNNSLTQFNLDKDPINKNELLAILDSEFLLLYMAIKKLFNEVLKSTSDTYIIIKCCREMIHIAATLYRIFGIIDVMYDEDESIKKA